jgi:hypothetical protein
MHVDLSSLEAEEKEEKRAAIADNAIDLCT